VYAPAQVLGVITCNPNVQSIAGRVDGVGSSRDLKPHSHFVRNGRAPRSSPRLKVTVVLYQGSRVRPPDVQPFWQAAESIGGVIGKPMRFVDESPD
jgi:hypothetical protein